MLTEDDHRALRTASLLRPGEASDWVLSQLRAAVTHADDGDEMLTVYRGLTRVDPRWRPDDPATRAKLSRAAYAAGAVAAQVGAHEAALPEAYKLGAARAQGIAGAPPAVTSSMFGGDAA